MNTNQSLQAFIFLWFLLPLPGWTAPSSEGRLDPTDDPILAKYKDYEAVIIRDNGKIRFIESTEGFDFVFERNVRMKINTSSGLHWADVEIPVYHEGRNAERLTEAGARVFNPEGELVTNAGMKQLDIYDEEMDENTTLKKFAVPGVTEGSVMEVNYTVQSPFKFHLRDWVFQYPIPVIESNLELTVVPFYSYNFLIRGTNELSSIYHVDSPVEKQFGGARYHERIYYFTELNIPAFEDESYITSRRDYIIRLEFQLARITQVDGREIDIMEDWPAVCKELLDHRDFGRYISAAGSQSKDLVGEMPLKGLEKEEAADYIVGYLKHNVKWNGKNRKFASQKFKDLLKVGEGNSAEINMGLIGMLNAAGIEAYPLIISTREHGKIYRDSPLHTHFNYVIAYIPDDNGYLLRDATDLAYPDNHLPVKCINGEGLLVDKKNETWIDLGVDDLYSVISIQVECSPVPEEHQANCSFYIASTGYDAIHFRQMAGEDPEKAVEYFENELISEDDSMTLIAGEETADSFNLKIMASLPVEEAGNLLLIHPFENLTESKNPFTRKVRNYPVDMIYQRERNYNSEIRIPEGYQVNHLPKEYTVDNDLMKIDYVPELTGENRIVIHADVRFKKRIYPSEDYPRLRVFYDEMVERFNEKVILEQGEGSLP